ncbi:MAG: adenylate/guanylate cyclase domain-containing protein [Cyanobacteria bacterium J06638_20]
MKKIQPFWIGVLAVLFPKRSVAYERWQHRFLWRRLGLTLRIAIAAYFTFIVMRLVMGHFDENGQDIAWLTMASTATLSLVSLWFFHCSTPGKHYPAIAFLGASWSITLIEQIWATLRGVAFPGVFSWTLVFLSQATIMPVRWPLHLASQLGVFAYYFIVNRAVGLTQVTDADWDATLWLYFFWFCAICNLTVLLHERLQYAEFQARHELEQERSKSEQLLLNILPEAIVEQLKQEHRTIAEHFSEVSVLFADIVGFTELSYGIPPDGLVTVLNQIFSEFDYLAEKHNLEKIKTIGDSYMVVGGLPLERTDHLEAIADMALDMQAAIARFPPINQRPLQMRIGINTGPVVAGVIGVKKFIYDLWGDTVNTASRMESHGVPGGIQVTESVYHRLKARYTLVNRGEIDVKGKGKMRVYLLTGKQLKAAEPARV